LLADLMHVTTRDGVRLDGMFQQSADAAGPVDAACLVHGTGGNFYSSSLFDVLAARLLDMGCAVLRVNTRGHDLMSTAVTAKGGKRLGAAYEVVDDCRHDLAAWVEWLAGRGHGRIALIGHSLGAVKCLYTVANDTELPVTAVAALSPPRLSYSWFCESAKRDTFLDIYRRAEAEATAGRPEALLEVSFPLPFVITAAGYLEKYGPDERYNFLKFIAAVPCPVLLTLGGIEVENSAAFQGTAEALGQVFPKPKRLTVEVIPGGDHFYSGVRQELGEEMEGWLRALR
jgi:alpha/beta superfamily hydrolase